MARPERRRRPSGARSDAAKRRPSLRSHSRSGNIITSAASRPSNGVPQPWARIPATSASRPCPANGATRAISIGRRSATLLHSAGDNGEATFWPSSSVRCAARCCSMSAASCCARTALALACTTEAARPSRCLVRVRRCAASSGGSAAPSAGVPSCASCSLRRSSCGCSAFSSASASRRTCEAFSDSIASVSVASASPRLRSTSFRLESISASCCFGVGSSSCASTGADSRKAVHSSRTHQGPRARIDRRKEDTQPHRFARTTAPARDYTAEPVKAGWAAPPASRISTSGEALPPSAAAAHTSPGTLPR